MKYIPRILSDAIIKEAPFYPVIVITGPRQTGKTTLCKHLYPDYSYYNLEEIALRDMIAEDPKRFMLESDNPMIIDEVQRFPELLSYIQVCVDENPERKFILTGSNDFTLMEKITQSLAGRASLFTLLPFSFKEIKDYVDSRGIDEIMHNGFYPGVIVRNIMPEIFYSNYLSTYLERDLRALQSIENLEDFRLFMKIIASRASCELNLTAISSQIGISSPTIKRWINLLKTSYIVFTLQPYYKNIGKRLTKTPKIYFYDTGLLCFMLGINNINQLSVHPLRGAIFENLAVAEFIKEKYNTKSHYDLMFYRENKGREVDILKEEGQDVQLFEIKSSKTFNKEYVKNLKALKEILGESVKSSLVIYDGENFPGVAVNIRDI